MNNADAYWQANLRLIAKLLLIWFVVPFLGGIVFVDLLNEIRFGGYKLGFWIAQQGSIYLFVVLIFIYAKQMNKLDDKFSNDELEELDGDVRGRDE
jgi:putative solute:sodium symporter small subunit